MAAGRGTHGHSRHHTVGAGVLDAGSRACRRTITANTLRYMWEVRTPLKMLSSSLILREFSMLKICAAGAGLDPLRALDTAPVHQVNTQVPKM